MLPGAFFMRLGSHIVGFRRTVVQIICDKPSLHTSRPEAPGSPTRGLSYCQTCQSWVTNSGPAWQARTGPFALRVETWFGSARHRRFGLGRGKSAEVESFAVL